MDVHKSKETLAKNSTLVRSGKKNENTRRSQTKEINSRYMSPTPAHSPGPRRYPSPGVTISSTHSRQSIPKRAVSVERHRPNSPPKQPTPLDTRSKANIWPSTVSVSNKEKTAISNLKILNLSQKQAETTRKATPERKRSPLKGKNSPDQSENNKPVEFLHARLLEHRNLWPSRTDKFTKLPLKKSSSELSLNKCANSDFFGLYKPVSSRFLGKKTNAATPGTRSQSLPTTPGGSRASSPSRGVRNSSPLRQPSNNSNNNNNNSVLTFTADIKKGKKGANHIEDAHELRLMYNKHLQWRYANARENAVLHSQKIKTEKMLYNVWETSSDLRGFVIEKRNELRQLKTRLKLHKVLKEQMTYLEGWSTYENQHISSLSRAVEDLRTSILRLPVTGRARGDVETVKAAICSAIEVMRAMGSSVSSILARVEGTSRLVSELADLAAKGIAMIHGCEALLDLILALQIEEYSLRTHLIQLKEN